MNLSHKKIVLLLFLIGNQLNAQFRGPVELLKESWIPAEHCISADIDQDGHLDLLCYGKVTRSSFFYWYQNDGEGNFSSAQIIEEVGPGLTDGSFQFDDFDQDGDIDIVYFLFSNGGSIIWLENEGNKHFSKKVISTNTGLTQHPFVLSDINNDGHKDLIVGPHRFEKKLTYFPNNGSNRFEHSIELADLRDRNFRNITVGDLNTDGHNDILLYDEPSKDNSLLLFFQNLGDGTMMQAKEISTSRPGWIQSLCITDFDKDGKNDILYAHIISGIRPDILFMIEHLDSNIFSPPSILLDTLSRFMSDPLLYDIDSDADLDIIVNVKNPPTLKNFIVKEYGVKWFENDGSGNLIQEHTSFLTEDNHLPYGTLIPGDFNGDSYPDLVLLDDDLFVFLSKDTLGFKKIDAIDSFTGIDHHQFIDFDQDGDLDITFSSPERFTTNFLHFLVNKDEEMELAPPILQTEERVIEHKIEDFNNDGLLDILLLKGKYHYGNHEAILYAQNERGEYDEKILFETERRTASGLSSINPNRNHLEVIDLNNDGLQDIIAIRLMENRITIFFNQGSGDFKKSTPIHYPFKTDNADYFNVLDFNRDGLFDIIFMTYKDNSNYHDIIDIPYYLQNADGTFDKHELKYQAVLNQSSGAIALIATFDSNGDTYKELMLCHELESDRSKYVFKWFPDSVNQNGIVLDTIHYQPEQFTFFDYNLDGKPDIFYTTRIRSVLSQFPLELHLLSSKDDGSYERIAYSDLNLDYESSFKLLDIDLDQDFDLVWLTINIYNNYSSTLGYLENVSEHPSIKGEIFWDKNENGKKDSVDVGINQLKTTVNPAALSSFSGEDGNFQFFLEEGQYTIAVENWEACWRPSTATQHSFNAQKGKQETINFGFIANGDVQSLETTVTSAPTRCSSAVPFWLEVKNTGCLEAEGLLKLVIDEKISFLDANTEPLKVVDDTLFWNIPKLPPNGSQKIKLIFQMPNAELVGDSIELYALTFLEDNTLSNSYQFQSLLRCAYDPNDKLVEPIGVGEAHYTLFGEPLEYTIRFQNTGNDTAFVVILRDTIDQNLDLSTLSLMGGSHEFSTLLDEGNRVLTFTFDNILLPDSTTNLIESNGYVKFKISPYADLPEGSLVQNLAGIYFDLNPPIITNTTRNILVSALPITTSTKSISNNKFFVTLYPNPFYGDLNIDVSMTLPEPVQLIVTDVDGKLIVDERIDIGTTNYTYEIRSNKFEKSGIYFYEIISSLGTKKGKIVKVE